MLFKAEREVCLQGGALLLPQIVLCILQMFLPSWECGACTHDALPASPGRTRFMRRLLVAACMVEMTSFYSSSMVVAWTERGFTHLSFRPLANPRILLQSLFAFLS